MDVVVKVSLTEEADNYFASRGDELVDFLPMRATEGSSASDLRAFLAGASKEIPAFTRALIPTGLILEVPVGYEGQIRPRSGLAVKHGITILNSPGTIDADYRGEVKVVLYNASPDTFVVEHGHRIAQLVISEVVPSLYMVAEDELSETDRGAGGFGHTGD